MRRGSGVVWLRVGLAAVVVLIGGLAGFVFWVQPRVLAGISYAAEFANDQILLGFFTIVVAMIFGWFAVEQVWLAQEAIEQDRAAREEARINETRRVLSALLAELDDNRTVGLSYARGLDLSHATRFIGVLRFRRSSFDALQGGPLWSVSQIEDIGDSVTRAYWEIQALEQKVRLGSVWPFVFMGTFVTAVLGIGPTNPFDRYMSTALSSVLAYVLYHGGQEFAAYAFGDAGRTVDAIEVAMDRIYRALHNGAPLPWPEWTGALPLARIIHEVVDSGQGGATALGQGDWKQGGDGPLS
jgi:hypothetical protein